MQNGLSKPEKLKSRKQIDALFAQRASFAVQRVRVFYMVNHTNQPEIKAGFGCSKKHFKQAVHRNRAKRLMREAYRIQKQALWQSVAAGNQSVHVFFLFSYNELINFEAMQNTFAVILQKLEKILEKSRDKNF